MPITRANKRIRDYFGLSDETSSTTMSKLKLFSNEDINLQIEIQSKIGEDPMPPAKSRRIERTLPRILIGPFYNIVVENGDRIEAQCSNCSKLIKGDRKSTGNYLNHYRTKHPELVDDLKEHCDNNPDKRKNPVSNVVTVGSAISKPQVRF